MKVRKFRKPYRIKRKKSILGNRFFWLGILILVLIGTVSYFLIFSETFQVKKIIMTGNEEVSREDLKLLIEKGLEKNFLFLKTKSIFLVDLNKIRKDILNNFLQIAEVELKQEFPDAINVLVKERLGLAIWCQKENCFLLDNEGVIFRETPAWTDLPKIIDSQEKVSLNLGEKVIGREELEKTLKIGSELKKNLKISIAEFSLMPEERLNVKTTEGWEIYFNLKENINWQLTKLSLVLEEEIPPENRGNLEYIDLRFSRVYYKYHQ